MNTLQQLWFSQKEEEIFLYLVEYWTSSASEVAGKLWYPKSSINFIADTLWEKGFLKKTFRKNTWYYEVDIDILEWSIESELDLRKTMLETYIPELREKNKNVLVKPKIIFLDGKESCMNAYRELLRVKEKVFYEFGAHADLVAAFGEKFMNEFIQERVKKKIFCESIGSAGEIEKLIQTHDEEHFRKLDIFSLEYGEISSSIAVYGSNVLILNLKWWLYSGVRVENPSFAETLKTVFLICRRK